MILLLGGTSESRLVASYLRERNLPFILSTATDYRETWNTPSETFEHLVTRFTVQSLSEFIAKRGITLIVDATHPFAREISETAMEVSRKTGVQYLRFERPAATLPEEPFIKPVHSNEDALQWLKRIQGNILFTTGVRSLPFFAGALAKRLHELYVRVLPRSSSLEVCERCGIIPSHIIAMEGPFDEEFNRLLLKKLGIGVLLTKETGAAGGLQEKIDACRKEQTTLILIRRPALEYPRVVYTVGELGRLLGVNA
jgi:precorrin-6A/cobalt-precorrin-6A reductase